MDDDPGKLGVEQSNTGRRRWRLATTPGRLTTRIVIAGALMAVLIGAMFVALLGTVAEYRGATARHMREDREVAQASHVEKLTLDLETGVRGYVITGEAAFLDPWRSARREYGASLDRLVAIEGPDGAARARSLRALGLGYLHDWADPTVALARRDRGAAGRGIGGEGKRRVDAIRASTARLIATDAAQSDRAQQGARDAQQLAIAIGVVGVVSTLVLIGLFALYIVRRVVSPIRRLAAATDRLSTGKLSERIEAAGSRELVSLGRSFNAMAAAVEANRRELNDINNFLDSILEHIPHMIFVKDAEELRFVRLNKRGEELLGYPREELLGKSDHDFFPPREADFFVAKDRQVLEGGSLLDIPEEPIEVSGGEVRYLHTKKWPLHDEHGRPRYLVGISEDVTDRRLADEALRMAKEEAERANRAKSEFLSRMSHELRTPLNAILGFGHLLQMDGLGEEQGEHVAHIVKAGNHLLELINEVLDISRIEAGDLSISTEPVAVDGVLSDAVSMVRPLAAERGVELEWRREHSQLLVQADRQRLKQVVLNLLSNAIKYNREGGLIRIACEHEDGSRLRILVSDTGPGIAPDRLRDVFAPFDRLGAEDGKVEGTGLGLALSEGLVERMGGILTVQSERGVGSTFSIVLPVAERPRPAAPAASHGSARS